MRRRQLGEADRIVTLFTREHGKVEAVAKGVRRPRSHFAGRLEFANECNFEMHRGRTLDVIVAAEIVQAHWSRIVEPQRYAVASVVAELIDAFCEPELAMPELYDLTLGAIAAIATAQAPPELLPRFSLRLLDLLGLAPPLESCVRCGHPLENKSVWLDAAAGGVLHAGCRERWRDLPELQVADLETLRALARPKGTQAAVRATPRAAAAAEELIAHHLGRRPKATAELNELTVTLSGVEGR
ncbi:MAG: DNA repair protein RecO [Candidatus Eremiobacteraeota bacterium]|nr:DNA repair protein RecO [Candidatus Eremiobacteraeota bacterium]